MYHTIHELVSQWEDETVRHVYKAELRDNYIEMKNCTCSVNYKLQRGWTEVKNFFLPIIWAVKISIDLYK